MSHYTMLFKYSKRTSNSLGAFTTFWGVSNKTIILLVLVGYEMTYTNSAPDALLSHVQQA